MTRVSFHIAALGLAVGVFSSGAFATSVFHAASGMSADNNPVTVSVQAELTISGDILTIILSNVSPGTTLSPAGLLCSYYFDIVNGNGDRPNLALASATGDVWKICADDPDVQQPSGANLVATEKDDNTWQFKSFDNSADPFLGFGAGTVGNGKLAPNSFNGNIVGGMDYGIYAGDDLATANLDGRLLVRDAIIFTFTGADGFTDTDISSKFAFGLGTAPDSLLRGGNDPIPTTVIPEPLTMAMLGIGIAGMGAYVRKRRLAA